MSTAARTQHIQAPTPPSPGPPVRWLERLHCQWHVLRFFIILVVFHFRVWLAEGQDRRAQKKGVSPRHRALRVGRRAGRTILRHFDLPVAVDGAHHIENIDRYCIVANHASMLDWALLLGYFPKSARFIAKKELGATPIVGPFLRSHGVLIDRLNREEARDIIRSAAAENTESPIACFPEGTRSPNGDVQPFKHGGLRVMAEAGMSFVPVTLIGTHQALRTGAHPVKVGQPLRMIIGPPITSEPDDESSIEQAIESVEQAIRDTLAQNPPQSP